MVGRTNVVTLPPGTHPLGLSIWCRGRRLSNARNYVVRVPDTEAPNTALEMVPGDRFQPYRL